MNFLDLFAGAGGLSEGFIRAGFNPIAHVESDIAACFTLKTRETYHWLVSQQEEQHYIDYLYGKINRSDLYNFLPKNHVGTVINTEIGQNQLGNIFDKIDSILNGKKIDLIIGGPPCQAYSVVGRSRDENRMKGDSRNFLYIYYAQFLKQYKPKFFVFENVKGLLSAKNTQNISYFDEMRTLFKECGYETEFMTLSAEEYGVPQKRKRVILVGRRGKKKNFYPEPIKLSPQALVEEIFSDLPSIKAGEGSVTPCKAKFYDRTWLYESGIKNDVYPITWHQSRPNKKQDLEIYKIAVKLWNKNKYRLNYNNLPNRLKTHQQRTSFLDRFKVVASNNHYAHTVVAHISKDGHYYIHPDIKQNRSLTPREAARLQTFPDSYFFESITGKPARTPAFRQIGNAVPVLLAQKIAEKLIENWS